MTANPQPERNEASALAAAKVAARTAAEGVEMPPIVEQCHEYFEQESPGGPFGCIELVPQNVNEHALIPG